MYRQCTTEKTAAQQKLFCEALYLSLQEQLYQDITITDLCAQTNLSRNIFYRLFDCKDDILCALIDQYFLDCSQSIQSENAAVNLESFFVYWKNNRILLDILEKNQLGPLFSTRGTICCCRMDFGMQKIIVSDWNNYDVEIISFYVSGFIGLLFYWYHTDFAKTPKEMANITFKLLNQPPLLLEP